MTYADLEPGDILLDMNRNDIWLLVNKDTNGYGTWLDLMHEILSNEPLLTFEIHSDYTVLKKS